MINKIYTGIGSRETPEDIKEIMRWIANQLYKKGYTLRSGGAPGADQAFEQGLALADSNRSAIQSKAEIYLPWANFELDNRTWISPRLSEPTEEAREFSKAFHPYWAGLSQGARKLMARNAHQVLGPDISKPVFSDFIICWTPGGKGQGGTGQALRIANEYNIAVWDMANDEHYDELIDWFYAE